MGRKDKKTMQCWEPAFVLYWCLTVKYINPMLLYFILMSIFKTDLAKPYGNYAGYWQAIGWAIPIIGVLIFVISFFAFSGEQELNYTESSFTIKWTPPRSQQLKPPNSRWLPKKKKLRKKSHKVDEHMCDRIHIFRSYVFEITKALMQNNKKK